MFIDLSLVIFSLLLGFGCYYYGKARGREEIIEGKGGQVYGNPVMPPGLTSTPSPEVKKKEPRPADENVWTIAAAAAFRRLLFLFHRRIYMHFFCKICNYDDNSINKKSTLNLNT